ncbi:MAG: phosphoenolpyruvate-utilizing N-terminal domain-containing protein [Candidatus Marinimicrobia bacterium]|nr:phosphoenolpyruvate-utilizing N-terminal domain-containing protein [Candidatus Neomarinimicrobiota bacterium]
MVKHEKAAVLPGISASPGIVIGKAYVRREDSKSFVPRTLISPSQINSELQRLRTAQDMVAEELENLREKIIHHLGSSYSDIISAQLAVLKDDEVRKEVESYMKEHHVNVAFAYRFVINQYIEFLEEHESEYFRERVADIRDIKQRVLRALISKHTVHSSLKMDEPTIFVAQELNPTDIVMLVSENVVGFVTEFGGKTSHAAIMARAMKVPMLIGIKDAGYRIETGQPLVL